MTRLKRKRRNKLMPVLDKILLPQRAPIECVQDQRKNSSQIEPTRHRRAINRIVKRLAAVVAYPFQAKKPFWDLFTNQGGQNQTLLVAASLA
jgi:Transposase DDE domain